MSEKWLRPYAVFKVLQDLFGTAEHWHWGALSRPTPRVRSLLWCMHAACPAAFLDISRPGLANAHLAMAMLPYVQVIFQECYCLTCCCCCHAVQMLQRLSSPQQAHYGCIQFTYWLQWHLHRQLRGVSLYAQQHRIALKGDLPIGAAPTRLCPAALPWTAALM